VCVREGLTCQGEAFAPQPPPELWVVPFPRRDMNRDGLLDDRADETVYVLNDDFRPIDLSGWSITDSAGIRFTFPEGTSLPPESNLKVYGGGVDVWVAPDGLGLDDAGDTVSLLNARGALVTQVSWRDATRGAYIRSDD